MWWVMRMAVKAPWLATGAICQFQAGSNWLLCRARKWWQLPIMQIYVRGPYYGPSWQLRKISSSNGLSAINNGLLEAAHLCWQLPEQTMFCGCTERSCPILQATIRIDWLTGWLCCAHACHWIITGRHCTLTLSKTNDDHTGAGAYLCEGIH